MSHSRFHYTGRVYLHIHGLIFEINICYLQDHQVAAPAGQEEKLSAILDQPLHLGSLLWEPVLACRGWRDRAVTRARAGQPCSSTMEERGRPRRSLRKIQGCWPSAAGTPHRTVFSSCRGNVLGGEKQQPGMRAQTTRMHLGLAPPNPIQSGQTSGVGAQMLPDCLAFTLLGGLHERQTLESDSPGRLEALSLKQQPRLAKQSIPTRTKCAQLIRVQCWLDCP